MLPSFTFPKPTYFPSAFRPMKGMAISNSPKSKHSLAYTLPLVHEYFISVKLDGIRFLTLWNQERNCSEAWSGQLIRLPSVALQAQAANLPPGIEGEIMATDSVNSRWLRFNELQRKVMAGAGVADFHFFTFDYWVNRDLPFNRRLLELQILKDSWHQSSAFKLLDQLPVESTTQVEELTREAVEAGYEGTILRGVHSKYKWGRATFNEHSYYKNKPFVDDEATVIGFQELAHNLNEAELSELGLTKRSSHIANLTPGNKLGALIVESPKWSQPFKIGTGFTDMERIHIWLSQSRYMHQQVTFKYQEQGTKDVPRIPVFKSFRDVRV